MRSAYQRGFIAISRKWDAWKSRYFWMCERLSLSLLRRGMKITFDSLKAAENSCAPRGDRIFKFDLEFITFTISIGRSNCCTSTVDFIFDGTQERIPINDPTISQQWPRFDRFSLLRSCTRFTRTTRTRRQKMLEINVTLLRIIVKNRKIGK